MCLSNSVKKTLSLYLSGNDLSQLLSKSVFYRHAKELKKCNIDITKPFDSRNFRVYPKSDLVIVSNPFIRIERD